MIFFFLLLLNVLHASAPSDEWLEKYQTAIRFEKENQWDLALESYLDAYQLDPLRAEPLCKLATHYRLTDQLHLAYLFAYQGARISQTDFVDLAPYELDKELSIAAYYTPFKEEGFAAANRLCLTHNVPWYIKEQNYKNLLFYVDALPDAHYLPIKIDLPLLHEHSQYHYNLMNPCIRKTEVGYVAICRTVNFLLENYQYIMIDHDPNIFIRTRNFLITLSPDFQVLSQKEIVEDFPRFKTHMPCAGLEDCRLANGNWFSCTTWGVSSVETPKIVLCKLGRSGESQVQVEDFIPLKGPDPKRCEKNWLPLFIKGALHFIYSYDPFVILKPDVRTGECSTVLEYSPKYDFSQFRGSAAPIEFEDGYLALVHEVVFQDGGRYYLHRLLFLDQNYQITKVSLPFYFQHLGVEYCCGMTLDHAEKNLVLSIGIEDREGQLCVVDLDTIRSLLMIL